jgi:hypothetical protein
MVAVDAQRRPPTAVIEPVACVDFIEQPVEKTALIALPPCGPDRCGISRARLCYSGVAGVCRVMKCAAAATRPPSSGKELIRVIEMGLNQALDDSENKRGRNAEH